MFADGAEEFKECAVCRFGEDPEGGVCLEVDGAAIADSAEC